MHTWLYTLRERFTSDRKERFDGYRSFSRFVHIKELVTLDSMMCPDVITKLRDEDWRFNVHEDYRTNLFRDADYLFRRQVLDTSKHQVIAMLECPVANPECPSGFERCGHDIMDAYFGNSTLSNCGPIPDVFNPSQVNNFGLIDDQDIAFEIRDRMRKLQPNDDHLRECEVWLLARKLPNGE